MEDVRNKTSAKNESQTSEDIMKLLFQFLEVNNIKDGMDKKIGEMVGVAHKIQKLALIEAEQKKKVNDLKNKLKLANGLIDEEKRKKETVQQEIEILTSNASKLKYTLEERSTIIDEMGYIYDDKRCNSSSCKKLQNLVIHYSEKGQKTKNQVATNIREAATQGKSNLAKAYFNYRPGPSRTYKKDDFLVNELLKTPLYQKGDYKQVDVGDTESRSQNKAAKLKTMESGPVLATFHTGLKFLYEAPTLSTPEISSTTPKSPIYPIKFVMQYTPKRRKPKSDLKPLNIGNLENLVSNASPSVPHFIINCTREIEIRGIKEFNLYKERASQHEIRAFVQEKLKVKGKPKLYEANVHLLCGCVKEFFNYLNEPLIPSSYLGKLKQSISKDKENIKANCCLKLLQVLPQANKDTLSYIIRHIQRIVSQTNLTVLEMAKIFGPCLMRYSRKDIENMEVKSTTQIMSELITFPQEFWNKLVCPVNKS